ncbi:ribosomal RNA large subunit methyltransferase N [Striga asiatica]|uniref:Ribosomal RNA large subunit methyltransferase N n=1 Tax=Striga asiatica TaxID=4170 RepID=A0A5A7QZ67_STRAF|nr:ribosomal RNA large subunit methyltransferase N [Striga asiatica]
MEILCSFQGFSSATGFVFEIYGPPMQFGQSGWFENAQAHEFLHEFKPVDEPLEVQVNHSNFFATEEFLLSQRLVLNDFDNKRLETSKTQTKIPNGSVPSQIKPNKPEILINLHAHHQWPRDLIIVCTKSFAFSAFNSKSLRYAFISSIS